MKIQAILFMCNDFIKAKFTLENFYRWNPDIPIRVVNSGGECPKPYLNHIPNIGYIDAPNLWHKETHCGKGSFGPQFADYLFDYGLNENYDYTLLLETDVLTNSKITKEPKYDISGPTFLAGPSERFLYQELNLEQNVHTGCGGTMFSKKYFREIKKNNYSLFNSIFEKHSKHYYMDMISTLVGRAANLTYGYWEETSNIPFHEWNDEAFIVDYTNTLIHNYKIDEQS